MYKTYLYTPAEILDLIRHDLRAKAAKEAGVCPADFTQSIAMVADNIFTGVFAVVDTTGLVRGYPSDEDEENVSGNMPNLAPVLDAALTVAYLKPKAKASK